MKFKVSVAMATYNGEKYIEEQITSILKNLTENDEIIVSDDGSSDNTISLLKKINDKRIKIVDGPKKGIIKNFENAINNTTGDIIFLSDQDDVWLENKVEVVKRYFELDSNLKLIVHDNYITDECLKIVNDSFFSFRKVKNGLLNNIIKNSFIGCCIAFKSEIKEEILPIPEDMMMHDQWIGLIALMNGDVKFIKEKLIYYRRHENNSSNFQRNSIFVMIKNRIKIIKYLIKYRRTAWKKK